MKKDSEKRRAVFLDRDGVINRAIIKGGKPYPPAGVCEVEILPGVLGALEKLKVAGFVLIVVTNQPDVGRGLISREVVEEINCYLAMALPIDRFIVCYHDDSDNCKCRKPLPGMLFVGASEFDLDLSQSFMVGDRWRDMEAGKGAGCKTLFIDYGYNEKQPKSFDFRVSSLQEAAKIILGDRR